MGKEAKAAVRLGKTLQQEYEDKLGKLDPDTAQRVRDKVDNNEDVRENDEDNGEREKDAARAGLLKERPRRHRKKEEERSEDEKPKKKRKWLRKILLLLVLVVAGAGGAHYGGLVDLTEYIPMLEEYIP